MSKRDNIIDFRKFLEQMFRLDGVDGLQLDFGIYRVIRLRENRIKSQLIDKLSETVDEVLAHFSLQDSDSYQQELKVAKTRFLEIIGRDALDTNGNIINPVYANTPVGKEYLLAKEQAPHFAIESAQITNDIFNHLLQFFGRHYESGDFMPRRCITKHGAYSLPYNGEDVVLHWANRGQYYVKTADRFLSYSFALASGGAVKFVVRDADGLPENNNKGGDKYFFPQIKDAIFLGNTLEIPMEHRAAQNSDKLDTKKNKLQEQINIKAAAAAENSLPKKLSQAATDELFGDKDNKGRHAFFRHLEKNCRNNDSDFFIHKDLSGFLSSGLDAYIKTDILDLETLAAGNHAAITAQTAVARAVHKLGGNIIARLGELEDFQKKLWEKKKFVLGTHYIVRLGAIDKKTRKKLLSQIIACDKQWKEWESLGIIAVSKKAKREQVLRDEPSLPLDTANFDEAFCDDLIASFDNLEDAIDGVCFHSENWQALNLMAGKYAGQVDVCYIDPPYNTDSSAIIYKNNYKDSSWLSFMHDRVELSRTLLTEEGVLCCAIDDEEHWRLRGILDSIFSRHLGVAAVRSNPAGRKSTGRLSSSHEYAIFYGNDSAVPSYLLKNNLQLKRYPEKDEKGKFSWGTFIRSGLGDKREDRPTMFYPIYVGGNNSLRIPKMEWDEHKQEYKILDKPHKGEEVVWPIEEISDNEVIQKRWERGWQRVQQEPDQYRVVQRNGSTKIDFKARMDEQSIPQTWWGDDKYASANYGTAALKKLFGSKLFDFPKALELVSDCLRASGANNKEAVILDYFGGSGTTAHAVIALNRKDGGKRKFIVAEMGEHFDTVVLPRIKKVIYTPYWKDGKPAESDNGNSSNGNGLLPNEAANRAPRLVKYHRLESYEDTLENIEFEEENKQLSMDGSERYMWEWESRNNIAFASLEKLLTPFDFKLKRASKNKDRTAADLPETFNLMSGMRLCTRRVVLNKKHRYQFDIGTLNGKETICVWRDIGDDWKEAAYEADRKFVNEECSKISNEFKGFSAANILTNGSCAASSSSIDPIFIKLMLGREE